VPSADSRTVTLAVNCHDLAEGRGCATSAWAVSRRPSASPSPTSCATSAPARRSTSNWPPRAGTEWATEAAERLHDAACPDGAVTALTETLADRPLFCDLLSHTSTTLEHNVSVSAARAFKRVVLGVLADLGADVARAHGGLTDGEGFELAAAATALAGTFYPVSNPPPSLVALYAEDPDIAAACPPFLPTLNRVVSALAAGLPTLR
jgi:hypothetical protein